MSGLKKLHLQFFNLSKCFFSKYQERAFEL